MTYSIKKTLNEIQTCFTKNNENIETVLAGGVTLSANLLL